jgi:hypothetical protein
MSKFKTGDIITNYGKMHLLVLKESFYMHGPTRVMCYLTLCLDDGIQKQYHQSDINYFQVVG